MSSQISQSLTERMPFPASMRRFRRHRPHRRAGRRSGRRSFDAWSYTYDAENRLVGAQNGTTRLEFIYDALGRRVAKKTYQNNTLSKHHRYVRPVRENDFVLLGASSTGGKHYHFKKDCFYLGIRS